MAYIDIRPAQPPAVLLGMPPGPAGVSRTLNLMRAIVLAYRQKTFIRQLAVDLTRGLKQKDYLSEAKAVHAFVRDKMRYVKDINGVETLHTPDVILHNRAGDCDDKTVLAAALLESLGHRTRLMAVGFEPGRFSHVLPEVLIRGRWYSVETTEPVPFGWTPPRVKSRMYLDI